MAYVSSFRNNSPTKYSSQAMDNWSFDEDFKQNAVEVLGSDGQYLWRMDSDSMATIIQEDGNGNTYIAKASPGSDKAQPVWKCQKIDESQAGFTIITWADGDPLFNNIATNLPSLTYV